jgi:ABC-type transport system substrate-binding protein
MEMKRALEEKGFVTTWSDPFFDWINKSNANRSEPPAKPYQFFIADPPVPKIAPFDIATIRIDTSHDSIYFAFIFYFSSVMEPCLEAEDFQEVLDKHDTDWIVKLEEYFSEIEHRFKLKWDIEYDITIEDTLYGWFPFDQDEKVIEILEAVKAAQNYVR